MPDIEKLNDVAAADIEAVNGVAKSSIQNINGVDTPSSGQVATRWVAVHDGVGNDFYLSYCAHSDRTSWTGTTIISGSHPDAYALAYGKDGSGNGLWATVTQSGNIEIAHDGNNDVTDGSTWTSVSNDSGGDDLMKCRAIAWGNDVWVAMGHMTGSDTELYRSTDGASWAEIDLSGVANMGTQTVYGLASDGAGTWLFGQNNRLYVSTDNASSWSQLSSYSGTTICDIGFTNNTWVILGAASPGVLHTTSASDLSTEAGGGSSATWGSLTLRHTTDDPSADTNNDINVGQTGSTQGRIACGGGVVVVQNTEFVMAADVNGSTVTLKTHTAGVNSSAKVSVGRGDSDGVINGAINTIATDGNGTWLVGSDGGGDGGEVAESTNNGQSWTRVLNNFTHGAGITARKFEVIRANVYLPV